MSRGFHAVLSTSTATQEKSMFTVKVCWLYNNIKLDIVRNIEILIAIVCKDLNFCGSQGDFARES